MKRDGLSPTRLLLTLAVLLAPIRGVGQTAACTDSATHQRMLTDMWTAFGSSSRDTVYQLAADFQAHALKDHDLDGYYNGWVCKIIYNLDRMNIYEAYLQVLGIQRDLESGQQGKDEQFLGPNMLALVYTQCGNFNGAIQEFRKAIDLIKGTSYEANSLGGLYLSTAHCAANADRKLSMRYIDAYIQELEHQKGRKRYDRNMADAYAFKGMLHFRNHDYQKVRECIRQKNRYQSQNRSGSNGSFLPYIDAYEKALNGDTDGAIRAIGNIANQKDRDLVEADIYRYAGQHDKAFLALRRLMNQRDSIMGVMIADNMVKTDAEVTLLKARERATHHKNVALTISILLALLLIAALVAINIYRRRYQRQLEDKNRQLSAANRRVTAASKMKTEFIRNVSHEIRTPLNIINGFSQVITDPAITLDDSERQSIADTIGENTQRITSLVNKMLSLADESTHDLHDDLTDVDCIEVCRQAVADTPAIDPTRVELRQDYRLPEGTTIHTSADALRKMLVCMLENAAKFTDEGYILLACHEDGEGSVDFTVEDTGCGIRPEDAPHIFERFHKGDEFKAGLGLGLAYCHETAAKLGGRLTLDQSYTEGCRFTLTLPIETT